MKIDLIGMILNTAGRRPFEGIIIDDAGKPLDAIRSLDHMIMEYAKVRNGGTSDTVVAHFPEELRQLTLAEQVKLAREEVATWPATVQEATRLPRELIPR